MTTPSHLPIQNTSQLCLNVLYTGAKARHCATPKRTTYSVYNHINMFLYFNRVYVTKPHTSSEACWQPCSVAFACCAFHMVLCCGSLYSHPPAQKAVQEVCAWSTRKAF